MVFNKEGKSTNKSNVSAINGGFLITANGIESNGNNGITLIAAVVHNREDDCRSEQFDCGGTEVEASKSSSSGDQQCVDRDESVLRIRSNCTIDPKSVSSKPSSAKCEADNEHIENEREGSERVQTNLTANESANHIEPIRPALDRNIVHSLSNSETSNCIVGIGDSIAVDSYHIPNGRPMDMEVADEEADDDSHKRHRLKTLKGLSYTCVSALFFSMTTVIVKYVEDMHPGQMAVVRYFGVLLFTFPLMMEVREHPFGPPKLRHWLIMRGIAGATSLYLRYCALHYLPIANATVIALSMPVFVCIFARVFLKEPCGVFHVLALAITLIGIALTTKLAIIFGASEQTIKDSGIDRKKELLGLLCSMGATLIGSAAYIIVRKIKCLHHSVILFNFSWVAIIETTLITYLLDGFTVPRGDTIIWLLVLLAVFSFYGQLLLTKALQSEEAGLVSVTRASSEVIYAFIFQMTIFREMPDVWSIIGATLVTLSVLLTSSRKWVLTLPEESRVRRALNFVTK